MHHQRTVKERATRASAVLALAGGGVLLSAAAAAAAPAATAINPLTAQVPYTCSLAGFGQGMAPLNVNATVSVQATVTAGSSVTVTITTAPTQIPTTTATQLPAINHFGLSGISTLTGSAGTGQASLTGQSSALNAGTGALTVLPAMTATGTVTPQTAGSWALAAPRSFQLTPFGTTRMAPVTCTAAKPATVAVTVVAAGTGTSTGTGTATAGTGTASGAQAYTCTITAATTTMAAPTRIPMQLRLTGRGMKGSPEGVFLQSAPGALKGSSFGGFSQWAPTAQPMSSSASLALSGASNGSVPLSLMPATAKTGQLALGGQFTPKTAGKFMLRAPHAFNLQMRKQQTTTTVTVSCTAAATTPSTAVQVQQGTAPATGAMAGSPVAAAGGAPNTGAGGSLSSSTDVALVAAGAVVVLGGAAAMLMALRRRGHSAL